MNVSLRPTFIQPTRSYDELAELFRPTFQKIADGAAQRDSDRRLPFEEVRWLKDLRFGALRLSAEDGGHGATLSQLFALLVELSAADSNIVQILRGHFGFVENLLAASDDAWTARWKQVVAAGELIAPGWTEPGDASSKGFSTNVAQNEHGSWRLNGRKFYTTGALYSEWIDVGARRAEDETVSAIVRTASGGLEIIDDWNGFGQTQTASGTATFADVEVDAENITLVSTRMPYQISFYQMMHLAALAGIAKAASEAAVVYVRNRKRTFSHGSASTAKQDPLVLQLLGQVGAKAFAARILTEEAARRLEAVSDAVLRGEAVDIPALDIDVYLAQVGVIEQTLEATTILFNGLGASALDKGLGLDRFWRNARAISSHNPVIYKERIVGDYAVNGTRPPESWLSGVS